MARKLVQPLDRLSGVELAFELHEEFDLLERWEVFGGRDTLPVAVEEFTDRR